MPDPASLRLIADDPYQRLPDVVSVGSVARTDKPSSPTEGGSIRVENDPLLFPKKEPSRRIMWLIDTASWLLPVLAAILSVGAGAEALAHADRNGAFLGIAGGLASAFGVLATGWASRVRDHRLEHASGVGNLSLNIASDAMSRMSGNF
jgi:hypothetical protein